MRMGQHSNTNLIFDIHNSPIRLMSHRPKTGVCVRVSTNGGSCGAVQNSIKTIIHLMFQLMNAPFCFAFKMYLNKFCTITLLDLVYYNATEFNSIKKCI